MAELFGAFCIQLIITGGLWKLFQRWNDSVPGILTASCLALFIATVVAGFGRADGRDPVFGEAFAVYVIPQLIVLLLLLWGWNRKKNRASKDA
jgi:hypothetical protein